MTASASAADTTSELRGVRSGPPSARKLRGVRSGPPSARKLRGGSGALLGLLCALVAAMFTLGEAHAADGVTDAAAETRIRELKDFLISSQTAEGSWNYGATDRTVGATALAILALKYAGLPNDHPAVAMGVQYILNNKTRFVYTEGLVPCAL